MKRRLKSNPDAAGSGLNLIEEATALLRSTPKATLAIYYVGAIPFVMAFLYFWTDMSRNAFAREHSGGAALGVALVFLWMKFWQAMFCERLRSQQALHPMRRWSWRQSLQVFLSQALLHSVGLFLLPLAFVVVLPLGWVYAFLQNVTVLADPDLSDSQLRKTAWKQANLWPWANHVMLGVFFLFAFVVFVNWMSLFAFTPMLMKMLLGIETAFSRSPGSIGNSTAIMAAVWMTYLCVDPMLKAAYLLRCFYGESRRSGEDLKAGLRQTVVSTRALTFVLVAVIGVGSWVTVSRAQTPVDSSTTQRSSIDPVMLDQKIDTVIHQPRYTWRMPRTAAPETEDGMLRRFVMATYRFFRNTIRTVAEWIDRILEWIFGGSEQGGRLSTFGTLPRSLPYALLLLAAVVLTVILIRIRKSRKEPAPVIAAAVSATPDLSDENVAADQLPEDGWTTLGRELLERGEYRLAIRAFYLATLAHLAQRNLIGIARFKSNRDYEIELRRRAHAIPDMLAMFGENLSIFERIWYGMHDVNRELVTQFIATADRIRSEA
jgi:hypothetical protein